MRTRAILLGVLAAGLASSALAGDDQHVKMEIAVVSDDAAGEKHFRIDSDDLGFDLHEMQEGESRSIVDDSGQSILVTRTSDGFEFNVDGETIEIPARDRGSEHGMVWVGKGDTDNVDVHVIHESDFATTHGKDDTVIISPEPIDATTQQAIKDLLRSAGSDSEVSFIDRDNEHGRKVMIRKVERVVENPQT